MFIYNIKLNGKSLSKIIFSILAIIISILFLTSAYKIVKSSFKVKDEIYEDVNYIETNNYTNVLKSMHENIDSYIGKKICFTGYVYKMMDFNENQFVLARNMITNEINKTLIVGFLCECDKAIEYKDDTWVEVHGIIEKGYYNGEFPIVKVTKIKETEKPNDEYVSMPDNTYIPTSSVF